MSDQHARALLAMPPDELFDPASWLGLVGFAKLAAIDPQRPPVLPVRSTYVSGEPSIGLNKLAEVHSGAYQICDLLASRIETGNIPQIEDACLLVAGGERGLTPVAFRGETAIDPFTDDFYRVLVHERQRLKRKPEMTSEERWRAQAAKITNNSISYGVKMQIQRDDHAKPSMSTPPQSTSPPRPRLPSRRAPTASRRSPPRSPRAQGSSSL